jgi:hypothetical protein
MSNNQEVNHETASDVARLYTRPAIVHELKLETRAGSPLVVDPLGIDPTQFN